VVDVALPLLRADAQLAVRQQRRPSAGHVHWFRRTGDDPFSGASLYTCRCGQVRPSF
jgi:hypothetical protein